MPSGASLQSKIASVLGTLQATSKTVRFRTVSRTGGNAVLGIGGSVATTDVDIDPQPSVEYVKVEDIATSGGKLMAGDLRMVFAGDIPESRWRETQILYGTEVLKVVRYDPVPFKGVVAAWVVIARTLTPGS